MKITATSITCEKCGRSGHVEICSVKVIPTKHGFTSWALYCLWCTGDRLGVLPIVTIDYSGTAKTKVVRKIKELLEN